MVCDGAGLDDGDMVVMIGMIMMTVWVEMIVVGSLSGVWWW